MDNLLTQQLPRLLKLLKDKGWVELPNAVPQSACRDLRAVLEERYADCAFRSAEIGQGKERMQRPDVRSDSIHWLEKDDPRLPVQAWLKEVEDLRLILNEAFFLSVNEYNGHFACYEVGASYEKHRDRFRGKATRVLSVILFLNEDWDQDDDGELLVYDLIDPSILTATIKPEQGTIVIFESETILHEVRRTKRRRLSLSGWLTRSSGF